MDDEEIDNSFLKWNSSTFLFTIRSKWRCANAFLNQIVHSWNWFWLLYRWFDVGGAEYGSGKPSDSAINACSRITRPSLYLKKKYAQMNIWIHEKHVRNFFISHPKSAYFWDSSVAYSYIHPSFVLQFLHMTSRTMWRPVSMTRSWMWVYVKLTTRLNSSARPETLIAREETIDSEINRVIIAFGNQYFYHGSIIFKYA